MGTPDTQERTDDINANTEKVRDTIWHKNKKPWLDYVNKAQITTGEMAYLYETVKRLGDGVYANIGTYRGASAYCMAAGLKHGNHTGTVHAVDWYDGVNGAYTREVFAEKIGEKGLSEFITPMQGDSIEIAKMSNIVHHGEACYSFIFIDADHEYDSIKADFNAWSPLLKPDGEIAFHDTNMKSVGRFISELSNEWEQIDHIYTIKAFTRS